AMTSRECIRHAGSASGPSAFHTRSQPRSAPATGVPERSPTPISPRVSSSSIPDRLSKSLLAHGRGYPESSAKKGACAMREDGRRGFIVEAISPVVDRGRYPAKRIVDEPIVASCDLVSDGHDLLAGALLYRGPGSTEWSRLPLQPKGNDRWEAT